MSANRVAPSSQKLAISILIVTKLLRIVCDEICWIYDIGANRYMARTDVLKINQSELNILIAFIEIISITNDDKASLLKTYNQSENRTYIVALAIHS